MQTLEKQSDQDLSNPHPELVNVVEFQTPLIPTNVLEIRFAWISQSQSMLISSCLAQQVVNLLKLKDK